MSTELSLLVEACTSVPAFAAAVTSTREIDWHRFGQLARHHKLGAVAYDRLSKSGDVAAPAEVVEPLGEIYHTAAVRSLAQEAETLEVVSLLERSGLRALVLKGSAAGRLLYPGEHHLRFSSDIDILVAPEDLAVAENVLKSGGFIPGQRELEMPGSNRSALLLMVHSLTYYGPTLGSAFDVHHRVSHNPHWLRFDFEDLYASSEEVELDGGRIRTLGSAHLACYMCCHMMDHAVFLLRWIEDAARALDRAARLQPDFDVTALHGLGAKPGVEQALRLINEMSGKTAKNGGVEASPHLARLIGDLENPRVIDENRTFPGLLEEFKRLAARADWGGSWSSAGHDLLMFLADPRDVVRLGLSKSWLPVYALTGPVFAAGRYIERRIGA